MRKKIVNLVSYILAGIVIFILIVLINRQVKEYHTQDDPVLAILKEQLAQIDPNIRKVKLYKGDKSYTINKETTYLCVHDENGEYYPLNHLCFVLLHEYAHILNTKDVGHTENFYKVFNELLEKATKAGIYNQDIPIVQDYCEYKK